MCEPIINVLYTVGGIILGWFVEYKYKIFSHRRNRFYDACVEFEQSFATTIHWLKNDAATGSLHIPGGLKGFKEKHITSINNFRAFLPETTRTGFDNACKEFFNEEHGHYYGGYGGDKKNASELALKNVYKLLKFAKH